MDHEHPAADPLQLFARAFATAKEREPFDATAMTLSTHGADGFPRARVVLLKDVDQRGFVFYSNRDSQKGKELDDTPRAALCFFWPKGFEQVRARGVVSRVSDDESDAYFATRPRGSQLGAWASHQSETLANRETLEARFAEVSARYEGTDVPRPAHWGGYLLTPIAIEFWYGRESRLHDRHLYERPTPQGPFSHKRLYP